MAEALTQFRSPEEEREHLRAESEGRYEQAAAEGVEKSREDATREVVREYAATPDEEVLHKQQRDTEEGRDRLALDLAPEEHDAQMKEFMGLVEEKGVKNALAIVERMNNPHLEDDFHRFLVAYIHEGYEVHGMRRRSPLSRTLHHTLYQVSLPRLEGQDQERGIKELLSAMEQFFAGMRSVTDENASGHPYYAIELALPESADEYSFYVSVPSDRKQLFEKQILSIYPDANITEEPDDYNVFNYDGVALGSIAVSSESTLYPIRTYEHFDHDPLNVILNSFSNVATEGEGAAIQFVLSPKGTDSAYKRHEDAVEKLEDGTSASEVKKWLKRSLLGSAAKELSSGIAEFMKSSERAERDKQKESGPDQAALESAREKLQSNFYMTTIRLISSAATEARAKAILSDMEASFNQFQNPEGNSLWFKRLKRGRLQDFLHNFTYRYSSEKYDIPLSTTELATMIHFETLGLKGPSKLKETRGTSVPAPAGLPKDGILLGMNRHRNQEVSVYMDPQDRLRHFYVIGQTGTGKTTLLKNMMNQDAENGDGFCFIDPHGADVQDILAAVPPERQDDVIYFDPSHTARPMALNMLEYNPEHPEQKTFVVNELFKIFQKLYSNVPESMGPMFEQYFRNAAMLVVEDPESGNTMLDISRVLTDADYREYKLSRSRNPVVNQFWQEVAGKAGGESSLQNIVPYITSKFDVFMSNEIMRPIIAQEHSSFNFRDIMDNKKILLVNLAKGTLGDANSNLLGLIIVGKILMATLSRVDTYGQDPAPFYLYIDEFQNVTTDSISTILSEARKYKLGLHIAHQFIAQLDEGIKDSVFGNVGSMCSFRVGSEDAEFLEPQFQPTVEANDLMNVENRNGYIRMLASGEPIKPFSLGTVKPKDGDPERVEKLKQLSYERYGEDRSVIEERIQARYRKEEELEEPSAKGAFDDFK